MWRTMMSINLDGVFLTVKHAARAMIAAGTQGSIITMGSVTALCGTPLVGHYAAAKAGVVNLTKTAALELRPTRHPGQRDPARLRRDRACHR